MPIPNSGMDALKTIDQFASFKTFLAGLVVFAERLNPIPSRTRPLNFPAPMVLSLKAWKSRSLPGLPRTLASPQHDVSISKTAASHGGRFFYGSGAPEETRASFTCRYSYLYEW